MPGMMPGYGQGPTPEGELTKDAAAILKDTNDKINRLKKLSQLFGPMFKLPDPDSKLDELLIKANANTEKELMKYVKEHKHKGSCFCKMMSVLCCPIIPCLWCNRCKVIPPDKWGLVVHTGYPEILPPGTHCLPSMCQKFAQEPSQQDPYIHSKNMHIIQIPKGKIGLAKSSGVPKFLDYGRHCFYDAMLEYHNETISREERLIVHGDVSIINVPMGAIGYGIETRKPNPVILAEGFHLIKSKFFKFVDIIDLTKPVNDIGLMKLVRVETGTVGVAYYNGILKILQSGLHLLIPPNRFHDFLSIQQTVINLPQTVLESGDYAPLSVKADVFFRVIDPELAVKTVDDIEKTVQETATATLAGIIRASTLNDIAKNVKPTVAGQADLASGNDEQSFYSYVHDHFIAELHDVCLNKWGIEFLNIRIENMKINDPVLQEKMASQSLINTQINAELANIEANKHIKISECQRDNGVRIQNAEAKKKQEELKAQAIARSIILDAQAKADALIMEATGESQSMLVKTKANCEKILRESEAEKKRLELEGKGTEEYAKSIEKSEIGPEIAKLNLNLRLLENTDEVYIARAIPNVFAESGMVKKSDQD